MIKAIVFDCFGVLAGQGFSNTYSLAGGNPAKDSNFIREAIHDTSLGTISSKEFHRRIADRLGISVERWEEIEAKSEQLNSDLVAFITAHLKPRYKIGLLSNANHQDVQGRIPPEIFSQLFDAVVVSADVGLMKPDPAIFRLTAEKLDVELDEIVFVDDIQGYVDAASALGMKAIHYKSYEQCQGELTKILGNQ